MWRICHRRLFFPSIVNSPPAPLPSVLLARCGGRLVIRGIPFLPPVGHKIGTHILCSAACALVVDVDETLGYQFIQCVTKFPPGNTLLFRFGITENNFPIVCDTVRHGPILGFSFDHNALCQEAKIDAQAPSGQALKSIGVQQLRFQIDTFHLRFLDQGLDILHPPGCATLGELYRRWISPRFDSGPPCAGPHRDNGRDGWICFWISNNGREPEKPGQWIGTCHGVCLLFLPLRGVRQRLKANIRIGKGRVLASCPFFLRRDNF